NWMRAPSRMSTMACREGSSSASLCSSACARAVVRVVANSASPSSSSESPDAPSASLPALARRLCCVSSSARASAGKVQRSSSPTSWRSRSIRAPRSSPPDSSRSWATMSRCRSASSRVLATASSLPPKASSICNCCARSSSAWCSCWPWISTSTAVSSDSCASETERPLIHAREPPSAAMTWRRRQAPSSSRACSANHARALSARDNSNSAASSARSQPLRTMPASARAPDSSNNASTSSDLPAPVSPVTTVSPSPNSMSAASTTAKLRTDKWVSMRAIVCEPDGSAETAALHPVAAARRPFTGGKRWKSAPAHFGPRNLLCLHSGAAARIDWTGSFPTPMTDRPPPTIDARTRQLLRTLIAQYLEEGQPVGSRTLARSAGLDVSPATVRNIMSDLEELGLVASPHTSAGRVPTVRGLRLFVDSLLELKPLPRGAVMQIQRELPRDLATPRELLGNASSLLSAMTHFVGLVTVPGAADAPLKQIEFVSLDARRVLAILVFADGQVQNRVLNLSRRFDARALELAANYLNEHYAGLRIDEIRGRVLADLRAAG